MEKGLLIKIKTTSYKKFYWKNGLKRKAGSK